MPQPCGHPCPALSESRHGPSVGPMLDAYAIVLGAAVWPGSMPSPTLRRRAETAARLYLDGAVAGLVATGGIGRHPPAEAEVARDIAVGLGVPPAAVILETRSRTTRENLASAKALLPDGARVVIVTDAWHLPRARLIARRLGIQASGAACSRSGTTLTGTLKAALREAAALAWEILRPMR